MESGTALEALKPVLEKEFGALTISHRSVFGTSLKANISPDMECYWYIREEALCVYVIKYNMDETTASRASIKKTATVGILLFEPNFFEMLDILFVRVKYWDGYANIGTAIGYTKIKHVICYSILLNRFSSHKRI